MQDLLQFATGALILVWLVHVISRHASLGPTLAVRVFFEGFDHEVEDLVAVVEALIDECDHRVRTQQKPAGEHVDEEHADVAVAD